MTERPTCGRCGSAGRDVRAHLTDLVREARLDGRTHDGPRYSIEDRCQACRDAARPPRGTK